MYFHIAFFRTVYCHISKCIFTWFPSERYIVTFPNVFSHCFLQNGILSHFQMYFSHCFLCMFHIVPFRVVYCHIFKYFKYIEVNVISPQNGTLPLLSSDVDLARIANSYECRRFTGADCRHLVDTAINKARDEKKRLMPNLISASSTVSTSVNGNNKRPLECNGDEPDTKKMKADDDTIISVTPESVSTKTDEIPEELKSVYPDGVFALYDRHFEAALKEVKPSVSDKVSMG